jgi:CheY-like chemotaxis protein
MRALIIDQDLDDRAMIQEFVNELGFETDLGITSFDVYDNLKIHEYDLLICNNLMPTLNEGFEIVKYIKDNFKDIYIIISSSIKDLKIIKELIELGADDYLIKPVDIDIFISKIGFKFDNVLKKEFASINVDDTDKESFCIVELACEIISISEVFIEIKVQEEVLINAKIYISGDFFKAMGIDKDSIELEVSEINEGILKCKYLSLSDIELALVRRWVLENYLL